MRAGGTFLQWRDGGAGLGPTRECAPRPLDPSSHGTLPRALPPQGPCAKLVCGRINKGPSRTAALLRTVGSWAAERTPLAGKSGRPMSSPMPVSASAVPRAPTVRRQPRRKTDSAEVPAAEIPTHPDALQASPKQPRTGSEILSALQRRRRPSQRQTPRMASSPQLAPCQ